MKNIYDILFNADRFGEGGAEGGNSDNASHTGEPTVIYGKQETANPEPTETADSGEANHVTEEQRRADFEKLIKGEYKDLYDERVKANIDRRFKSENQSRQQYQDLNDALLPLYAKFGLDMGDVNGLKSAIANDYSMYSDEAESLGMTEEQLAYMKNMEFENMRAQQELQRMRGEQEAERAYQGWLDEAETVKESYPDFDLASEVQNERFVGLLDNGFSVKEAYEAIHASEIIRNGIGTAAQVAEAKVVNQIRSRNARPDENGMQARQGVIFKTDPKDFSDKDFDNIIKKVKAGDRIVLG